MRVFSARFVRRFVRLVPGVVMVLFCLAWGTGCSRQARIERHLARAEQHFQQGDYPAAVIEYRNVLQADPEHATAVRQIGLALYETGDIRAALPYLEKASRAEPGNTVVTLKLGSLQLVVGERAKAREIARTVLDRAPDNLDALLLWAGAVSSSNEVEESIARLQTMGTRLEREPRFHLALAILHLMKGAHAAAEAVYRKALEINPKSWELHLALGDLLLARRDLATAGKEYQLAADQAPAASQARIRLARFRLGCGDNQAAKQILAEILRQAPAYGQAQICLAEIALAEGEPDSALAAMTQLVKTEPRNLEAAILLQRAKLALRKVDEAIAGLERIVSVAPGVAPARFYLGLAWLQKGDEQKALPELERAVQLNRDNLDAVRTLAELYIRAGKAESAIALLKEVARRWPGDAQVYQMLGAAYSAKQDYAQAVEAYRIMAKGMTNSPRAAFLLGIAYQRQGRETEAVAQFEDALKLDPGFEDAVRELASLEIARAGNWDAAVARIQRQIEKAPDKPNLYCLLGNAQAMKRDWASAEQAFRTALKLKPGNALASRGLSRVFGATGKIAEALAEVEKTLATSTNDLDSLMLKGTLLLENKNPAAAAEQYASIVKRQPAFVPALNDLAILYQEELNRPDEAYDLAQRARRLAPKDPAVADTLGWIAYGRGELKWAFTLLQESLDLLPNEPQVRYHLGMCQVALGDELSARTNLAKAVESATDYTGLAQAKAMLAILATDEELAGMATEQEVDSFLGQYPGQPLALVRAGAFHEKNGAVDKAQQAYEKALVLTPHFVPAQLRLAGLLADSGRQMERALALAKTAMELAPENPRVVDCQAWVAFRKGDYKWAQSLYAELQNKKALSPEQQYHLGMVGYVAGNSAAATNSIAKALSASASFRGRSEAKRFLERATRPEAFVAELDKVPPADRLAVEWLPVLLAQAEACSRNGEYAKTQALCEPVAEKYPGFSPAFRLLAAAYAGQKTRSERAFNLLVKARELLPDDPQVSATLGLAVYAKGEYEWAATLLQGCVDQLPDQAELRYALGFCYHQLKKTEPARQALQRGLALDPKSDSAGPARKILAEMK